MNWTNMYRRIPDRVRLGVGGIALAMLLVTGPRLIAEWLRIWS